MQRKGKKNPLHGMLTYRNNAEYNKEKTNRIMTQTWGLFDQDTRAGTVLLLPGCMHNLGERGHVCVDGHAFVVA